MQHQLNRLAVEIYAQNKAVGWWDNPDRDIYQTLQLVNTEVAEATEGERKNLMDDKIKHRRMGEVELADAVIRLLDLGGRYGWEVSHDLVSVEVMSMKEIAGAHFFITTVNGWLGTTIFDNGTKAEVEYFYGLCINSIFWLGAQHGYDVMGALHEKVEFNKTREDHKRSARAQEHGKKF